jgi:hypothetical protein
VTLTTNDLHRADYLTGRLEAWLRRVNRNLLGRRWLSVHPESN